MARKGPKSNSLLSPINNNTTERTKVSHLESSSTSHLSQSLTLLGEHRAMVRVARHKKYCHLLHAG